MTLLADDPITLWDDDELDRAIERAWRVAAREWLETRDPLNRPIRWLLLEKARNAQRYWQRLVDERQRRRPNFFASDLDPETNVELYGDDVHRVFVRP